MRQGSTRHPGETVREAGGGHAPGSDATGIYIYIYIYICMRWLELLHAELSQKLASLARRPAGAGKPEPMYICIHICIYIYIYIYVYIYICIYI